ncbi:SMP-30/gluconolactonase/LRE family protein [Pseudomonas sp. CIP-10]|uniref:SMP-30/gluconolactonase/LRE family protein n=1 Tax=Pseudomonas sp. CIP-10 TaxID=2892442 RepID=UPI001E3DEB44|nr:SMP-30/gluconolactonase/LRE family protein [Pseudomonas sp. CIP-10]UFH30041.1 SMP-30/gluconolactonase/LRE family protein [Pseudomonas sp. CIP-10]
MLRTIYDAKNSLGECPIWCDRTHRLFWTNILGQELSVYSPESVSVQTWSMPERLASFALTDDNNVLLLGLESRLAFFSLDSCELFPIADSPGAVGTRLNDGRCDRQGNFVFGTMHESDVPQPIGAFYRLNAISLEIEPLPLRAVAISNSICFCPSGKTMYYSDSTKQNIFCCDYPSMENQRIFVEVVGDGVPDGSCIDAEGCLWNAQWGGSRVVRYTPDGKVDCIVEAVASQTTCPAIGGPNQDILYCTSARVGLSSPSEDDGALLTASGLGIRGIAESRFSGSVSALASRAN